MVFPLKGKAKTCRGPCSRPDSSPSRDDYQDRDREKVGEHPQNIRRDERKLSGFEIELQGIHPTDFSKTSSRIERARSASFCVMIKGGLKRITFSPHPKMRSPF